MDYNRKGMYAETVYAYDSTETALQTISSFKKGKLVRFTDYRCLPPKDTLKAEVSSICKRTDKDPMGNILEITERKIENKTYLVTKKIMPEKHLLLEVIMKGPNRRYSYRITYTYNEEGNLVELVRYERGKDKPVETRKFYYNKLLLERSEFLRKGQLKTVYTYEFRKTL